MYFWRKHWLRLSNQMRIFHIAHLPNCTMGNPESFAAIQTFIPWRSTRHLLECDASLGWVHGSHWNIIQHEMATPLSAWVVLLCVVQTKRRFLSVSLWQRFVQVVTVKIHIFKQQPKTHIWWNVARQNIQCEIKFRMVVLVLYKAFKTYNIRPSTSYNIVSSSSCQFQFMPVRYNNKYLNVFFYFV